MKGRTKAIYDKKRTLQRAMNVWEGNFVYFNLATNSAFELSFLLNVKNLFEFIMVTCFYINFLRLINCTKLQSKIISMKQNSSYNNAIKLQSKSLTISIFCNTFQEPKWWSIDRINSYIDYQYQYLNDWWERILLLIK